MTEAPVKRRSHTIVPKIEEVENGRLTFRAVHGDVHELDGFVARVVDCVRMAHTQGRAGWTRKEGRTSVDAELRRAVEDQVHLFGLVVEVMTDAAFRLDYATMDKEQVGAERVGVHDRHAVDFA